MRKTFQPGVRLWYYDECLYLFFNIKCWRNLILNCEMLSFRHNTSFCFAHPPNLIQLYKYCTHDAKEDAQWVLCDVVVVIHSTVQKKPKKP